MKFAIATLGCKVNQYESQLIREALLSGGFSEQDFSLPGADLYIVNTCTVTHRSDAEDRRLVRRAEGFGARTIVTGCRVKVSPGSDGISTGSAEMVPFEGLAAALGVHMPEGITGFSGHARAFVNIQQGCSNCCAFCIVPLARGKPRSRPVNEIVNEVVTLYSKGFREIILTGINIGLYEGGLVHLIQRLLDESPMPRLRISSLEPWTLTDELMDMILSEKRICRHLHLPLQSGSDRILSLMGRPYDAPHYRRIVSALKETDPGMAIGADVMVGFPGETEEDFLQTLSLVQGIDITYLHVFPFSRRKGTRAYAMPGQVDPRIMKQRAAELRDLSREKRKAFIASQVGKNLEVLVTTEEEISFSGITSNYIKVEAQGKASVNDLVMVGIEEAHDAYASGRPRG